MEKELKEIQEEMIKGQIPPHKLGDYRARLAGHYSFVSSRLEEIVTIKPAEWNKLRPNFKSDTAAERAWEATDEGITEGVYKLKLKRIEKMIGALKSLLEIAEGQGRNNY